MADGVFDEIVAQMMLIEVSSVGWALGCDKYSVVSWRRSVLVGPTLGEGDARRSPFFPGDVTEDNRRTMHSRTFDSVCR